MIDSILSPVVGEEVLLHKITEHDDDDDEHDAVVYSWMKCLKVGKEICFETMYQEDIAARVEDVPAVKEEVPPSIQQPETNDPPRPDPPQSSIEAQMLELEQKFGFFVQHIEEKIDLLAGRVKLLEDEGRKKGKERASQYE